VEGSGRKRLVVFILLIALILAGIVVGLVSGLTATPVTGLLSSALSPIQQAMNNAKNRVLDFYAYVNNYEILKAENEALKQEISDMRRLIRNAEKDSKENEIFRNQLGLRQKREDFELESAYIIAKDDDPYSNIFTINKGEKHGVKENDCVIINDNLVGFVTMVSWTSAEIITIIDTSSEIGAIVSRTGEPAIAEGNYVLMRDQLFKLSYLDKDTYALAGDEIVTSGLGDIYPPGLVIGVINEIHAEDHGVSNYAICSSRVDFSSLTLVFVVKNFDIEG